jgi:hypothetical protein
MNGQTMRTTSPSTDLHVEHWGDGIPVVLVHGSLATGAQEWEAQRPLEPAVLACGMHEPAWSSLVDSLRSFWRERQLSDHDWVVQFLIAVGSDPSEFPPEFLDEAAASAPLLRNGRPPFDAELPLDAIRAARYPKLVVSGGHHIGFEAMCVDLADCIGADSAIVEGAGHEIQFTGSPLNEILARLWQPTADHATIAP